MAYDERLAQRIREFFADRNDISERKMFGGIAFMLSGHMGCGVQGNQLLARVGPAQYAATLGKTFARAMDFAGKPMQGYIYVDPKGIATAGDLAEWLKLCYSMSLHCLLKNPKQPG